MREIVWMKKILNSLKIGTENIKVYSDNQPALHLIQNPNGNHRKFKHVEIRLQFLRENIIDLNLKLEYCPTREMLADILTKPLPKERTSYLKSKIGVIENI